jgi:hypothetical protein
MVIDSEIDSRTIAIIAGSIVGALLLCGGVATALWLWRRRRQQAIDATPSANPNSNSNRIYDDVAAVRLQHAG